MLCILHYRAAPRCLVPRPRRAALDHAVDDITCVYIYIYICTLIIIIIIISKICGKREAIRHGERNLEPCSCVYVIHACIEHDPRYLDSEIRENQLLGTMCFT